MKKIRKKIEDLKDELLQHELEGGYPSVQCEELSRKLKEWNPEGSIEGWFGMIPPYYNEDGRRNKNVCVDKRTD